MQTKGRKSPFAISMIASLAVVALLIVASVFATYSYLNANGGLTRTVSVTTTLTTITPTTTITTIASTLTTLVATSHSRSSQVYVLVHSIKQIPCKNFGTIIPWSVVFTTSEGIYNITEPSNSNTPVECCGRTRRYIFKHRIFGSQRHLFL